MRQLYIIFIFLSSICLAQSNNTVTFSGNSSDFNPSERIFGGNNVDYYVTFDETHIYFGAFRTGGQSFGGFDHFTIYIDSDPKPTITTGNGSQTGLNWDNQTPNLPFNADHRFAIRNNNLGESFHHDFTGSSWQDQTSSNTSNFTQFATSSALEIRIPKSSIDDADGIYFTMYMSFGGGGGGFFGYEDSNYPLDISGSTISGYFGGIGINAPGCVPVTSTNTPILDELADTNPTNNGKYAYIEITSGDYSVTGDIEIVQGGTGTIIEGNSLTVEGQLTNNGNLELESSSSSYSSLIVDSYGGSGNITYNRFTAEVGPTGTNDLIASPVSGQQFNNFASANSGDLATSGTTAAFAPFNPTSGNYENKDTSDTDLILPGIGYRAGTQASGGEDLAFSGTPNSGNIPTISLTDGAGSFWNLMGNPYPSYIRLGDFLAENVSTTNINDSFYGVYGYDADLGDGSLWTILDLNSNQDILIAPGQGFFVAAPSGGGSGIDFTASMQRIGSSGDFISRNSSSSNSNFAQAVINLNTTSTTYETNVYFRDSNTRGLDPGFDTGAFDQNANGIYTHLVEDNAGVALANQSLPYNDLTDIVVPLVVNIDPAEQITFSLNSGSDLPESIDLYLDDTLTSISTLLNSGDYTITPSTVLNGAGRFFLRFAENALTIEQSTFNTISISAQNKEIIISGEISSPTKANLYDLQGRLVLTNSLNVQLTRQTIDASRLSSGIYIIELSDGETSMTKKIILN